MNNNQLFPITGRLMADMKRVFGNPKCTYVKENGTEKRTGDDIDMRKNLKIVRLPDNTAVKGKKKAFTDTVYYLNGEDNEY